MYKHWIPIVMGLFFFSLVMPAWGRDAHGLSKHQIKQLKSLKQPVLVPGKLPPGFRLKSIEINEKPGSNKYAPSYRIDYRCFCSGANITFSLLGSKTPFRQGVTTDLELIDNAHLDKLRLGYYPPSKSLGLNEAYWMTAWHESGALHHALLSTYQGKSLSKNQAMEIVKFLKFLD